MTITQERNDSIFLVGRANGAQLLDPNSVFSIQMDSSLVADEIWKIQLKSYKTGQHVYAEVLKCSNSAFTIEEFIDLCIDGWELVRIVEKIWEDDF